MVMEKDLIQFHIYFPITHFVPMTKIFYLLYDYSNYFKLLYYYSHYDIYYAQVKALKMLLKRYTYY